MENELFTVSITSASNDSYFEGKFIPTCLSHSNWEDALEDATAMTVFVESALEAIIISDGCNNKDVIRGFNLCMELLRDKIKIASLLK